MSEIEEEFIVDCVTCEEKYTVYSPLGTEPVFCSFCGESLEQAELNFNE